METMISIVKSLTGTFVSLSVEDGSNCILSKDFGRLLTHADSYMPFAAIRATFQLLRAKLAITLRNKRIEAIYRVTQRCARRLVLFCFCS